jgi:hypothetical protein
MTHVTDSGLDFAAKLNSDSSAPWCMPSHEKKMDVSFPSCGSSCPTTACDQHGRLDSLRKRAVRSKVAPRKNLLREGLAPGIEGGFEITALDSLKLVRSTGLCRNRLNMYHDGCRTDVFAFQLISSFNASWTVEWRDSYCSMTPGDLMLTDMRHMYSGRWPAECTLTQVILPTVWISTWLNNPAQLSGVRIDGNQGWGGVLSAFIHQLAIASFTTEFVPARLLSENLGALLSLTERQTPVSTGSLPDQQCRAQIESVIHSRSGNSRLTAFEVAQAVEISEKKLYRLLASKGENFHALVLRFRMESAKRGAWRSSRCH